jgi:hypothetical protein
MPESGVTRTVDNTAKVMAAFDALTRSDVLVGVPQDKSGRKQGPITNASLAYIHEFGSPARNIPARPFLYPGIRKAREAIAARMRQGAQQALKGDQGAVDRTLNAVGMLARNAVVRAITDPSPPFVPLKPATIRARLRKTAAGRRLLSGKSGTRKQRAAMQKAAEILAAINYGGGPGIKPLIDTGQLRAAITYVVRKNVFPAKYATTDWGYQREYGKMHIK